MEEGSGKRSITSLSGFRGSKRVDERHIEFRSDGVPIGDTRIKICELFRYLGKMHNSKLEECQCRAYK
jgi:hypothetical protein